MGTNDLERLILDSISVIENYIRIYNSSNILYLDHVSYFVENAFYLPEYAIHLCMMLINSSKGSPKVLYAFKNVFFREDWYLSNFFDFGKVIYSYDDVNKYFLRILSLRVYTKMSLSQFLDNFFDFLYHVIMINRLSLNIDFVESVLEPISYKLTSSNYYYLKGSYFYFDNIDFSVV